MSNYMQFRQENRSRKQSNTFNLDIDIALNNCAKIFQTSYRLNKLQTHISACMALTTVQHI
ncbi:unnamed protein product [marine sediment metagenome]|uniref:Uncharacterized protein n=1 Tax=marine sediment metagenome TaxID=412755 RepID=X0WF78_9ZZZZ